MAMTIAITTNVYGRPRASRTIHIRFLEVSEGTTRTPQIPRFSAKGTPEEQYNKAELATSDQPNSDRKGKSARTRLSLPVPAGLVIAMDEVGLVVCGLAI